MVPCLYIKAPLGKARDYVPQKSPFLLPGIAMAINRARTHSIQSCHFGSINQLLPLWTPSVLFHTITRQTDSLFNLLQGESRIHQGLWVKLAVTTMR